MQGSRKSKSFENSIGNKKQTKITTIDSKSSEYTISNIDETRKSQNNTSITPLQAKEHFELSLHIASFCQINA